MGDEPTPAGVFGRMLVQQLDAFPAGALLRAGIGYALVPIFRYLVGPAVSDWLIVPWFVAVLVGFRVLPAVVRAVVPFSQTTKAVWTQRRNIAKRFDAYQWRKLLWFGVGMAAYALTSGNFDATLIALSSAVTVAGCLGEYTWRRHGARVMAAERQSTS